MERKEVLEKLKATEAEIQKEIEQAERTRNEILTKAQKEARKLEEDNEQHLRREREEMLATARTQIDEERWRVLQQATAEADQLKKNAQMKKTQDLFLGKFKESTHV